MGALLLSGGVIKLATLFTKKYALRKALMGAGIAVSTAVQLQKHEFYRKRNKEMKEKREQFERRNSR